MIRGMSGGKNLPWVFECIRSQNVEVRGRFLGMELC